MAIAPAGASLHCNCHCGGQGTGRGSTVTQLQIQSSSGLTNGQCLGPVPASLSACIALHACMVAYWRGREEGGGVCCVTPGRRLEREPRLLFHPSNPRRPHQTATGRRDGDASHDAMQAAEATRQAPTTRSVTVRFSGYSGAFPREKRKEPGASFQTLHTHRCRGFAVTPPQTTAVSCHRETQGGRRRDRTGECTAHLCWELGKGRGKVYIFFVCLLFLSGL